MSNKLKRNFICGFTILIFFAFLFALNSITFFTSDDYIYHYIYKSYYPIGQVEKINGIQSIIESQTNHYFIWNGRFVAHTIVQFFMQFDKLIFNIFNSLAFIALGGIIWSIVNKVVKITHKNLLFVQILLLLWLFIPEFGKTVLWMSGSGNYLWTSLIYLSFFLFNLQSYKTTVITVAFSIILGFLSGATNENSGPAISVMVVLLIIWEFYHKKKVSLWRVIGVISSSLGFILMMKSPGSLERGKQSLTFEILKTNFENVNLVTIQQFQYLYLLILVLLIWLSFSKKLSKQNIIYLLILITGYLASVYSLVLSPTVPLRTLFGPALILILLVAYLSNMAYQLFKIQILGTLVLIILSLVVYRAAFLDIMINTKEVNQHVAILNKASSEDKVTLNMLTPSKSLYNPYNGTANLTKHDSSWFNRWMAHYFDVKSITGKEQQ